MWKVVFDRIGGPEVLRFVEADVPAIARDAVLVRVKALGLNRAEASMRRGTYIETPTFPAGLGLEAAGVVEAVGEEVATIAVGEAVSVVPPISMVREPTYAEFIAVPATRIVKHPSTLDWSEAAATWMAHLTAYGALVQVADIRPGEFVAITAASSSVGLAAIQVARLIGAVPIAITRGGAKRDALLQAGAGHVIAMDEEPLAPSLIAAAHGVGPRVVLEAVGGPIFDPLTEAMARGGILIEYGGLSAEPTPFPLANVLGKRLTLRGYLVHEITGSPARLDAAQRFILDGLTAGGLRPTVSNTFPLDRLVEAHHYLESNTQIGKVVVTV